MIQSYKRNMYKLVNWSIYLIFFVLGFLLGGKYGTIITTLLHK